MAKEPGRQRHRRAQRFPASRWHGDDEPAHLAFGNLREFRCDRLDVPVGFERDPGSHHAKGELGKCHRVGGQHCLKKGLRV